MSVNFEENMKLVSYVINRYFKNQLKYHDIEDIYQVGYIGLLKAVRYYDEDRGMKFSTYAVPVIWGYIKQYVRGDSLVKVPRADQDYYYKCLREGIEDEYMLSVKEAYTPRSLSSLLFVDNANSSTIEDTLEDAFSIDDIEVGLDTEKFMWEYLTAKQHIVLQYRMEEWTQQDIGKQIGCSQVQVYRYLKQVADRYKAYAAGLAPFKRTLEEKFSVMADSSPEDLLIKLIEKSHYRIKFNQYLEDLIMALSDEKKKQMETYFKEGQSITSVARQVGVAYQTARKYKEMLEKEGEKEEQSAPEEEMSGECFNDLQTAFVPLLEDTPCPNPPQDILFQAVLGKYILKDFADGTFLVAVNSPETPQIICHSREDLGTLRDLLELYECYIKTHVLKDL